MIIMPTKSNVSAWLCSGIFTRQIVNISKEKRLNCKTKQSKNKLKTLSFSFSRTPNLRESRENELKKMTITFKTRKIHSIRVSDTKLSLGSELTSRNLWKTPELGIVAQLATAQFWARCFVLMPRKDFCSFPT